MSSDEIKNRMAALDDELKAFARPVDRARKAFRKLKKKNNLDDIAVLNKELRKLNRLDLPDEKLQTSLDDIKNTLDGHLRKMKHTARGRVLSGVQELAQEEELQFKMVAETPPTFVLSPFTVELDIPNGAALVCYAREEVLSTALEPDKIVQGREKAMKKVRGEAVESSDFFDLLARSYNIILLNSGGRPGDRVDLVDLLAPLALLRVDQGKWRSVSMSRVDDFPRYLLAYQLSRLRRDGILQKDGKRIELGTATGGSTRNKKNVLFVPVSPVDGQYYLSVRVTPAR